MTQRIHLAPGGIIGGDRRSLSQTIRLLGFSLRHQLMCSWSISFFEFFALGYIYIV